MSSNANPVNVISIKWGDKYHADYVNRLFRGVARNITRPVRMVCFTEDAKGIDDSIEVHPLPNFDAPERQLWSNWRKLSLFRDDLPISGPALFLDLDILITGPLDDFFDYGEPDEVPIIHNWIEPHKTWFRPRPAIGNSSVFRIQANQMSHVYAQYLEEMEWATKNFHPPQTYLTHCIRPQMIYWPDQWVVSFKRHLHRTFPLNWVFEAKEPGPQGRIVAFHGKPRPEQALEGYRGSKPHHRVRPTQWLKKYWK